MTDGQLGWRTITARREAVVLKNFTCTTDPPKTPGGRKLKHPRPWEWEAQRHLRQTDQLLGPGDMLLLGESDGVVLAAMHLQIESTKTHLDVYLAAGAVNTDVRRQGGAIADAMLAQVRAAAASAAGNHGFGATVLRGKIHLENRASRRMVERAGFEPFGLPLNDYQEWRLVV